MPKITKNRRKKPTTIKLTPYLRHYGPNYWADPLMRNKIMKKFLEIARQNGPVYKEKVFEKWIDYHRDR